MPVPWSVKPVTTAALPSPEEAFKVTVPLPVMMVVAGPSRTPVRRLFAEVDGLRQVLGATRTTSPSLAAVMASPMVR